MKQLQRLLVSALTLLLCMPTLVKADEGMWLLPYLKQQNIARMQQMGLTLSAEEIYAPGKGSVIDAIVHFDGGCTGEIVSDQGLLFTNHHCGFDQIRSHSTVEHNYLRDGFYAPTLASELPNPGLVVTLTEDIVNITEYVQQYLRRKGESNPLVYLQRKYLQKIAEAWYQEHKGARPEWIKLDLAPYYEGNQFWLNITKEYSDVRLVAAPPRSVGSYGEDTDNWVWPRHSGDFSVFRIYTAPDGTPTKYSAKNIPLKPKHFLKVNSGGLRLDDFVMIIGFPGRTNHFYTAAEVAERRDIDNNVRIDMRRIRQEVMLAEMRKSEKVNIQYGTKYQRSTNAYKNAIGSNWAINKMDFEKSKRAQAEALRAYAAKHNKSEYIDAVSAIEAIVSKRAPYRKLVWMIDEGLLRAVETIGAPLLDAKKYALLKRDAKKRETFIEKDVKGYFNADYDKEVDRKVTRTMLEAYIARTTPQERPEALRNVSSLDSFIEALFTSVYFNPEALSKLIATEDYSIYQADPVVRLASDTHKLYEEARRQVAGYDEEFARLRQIYVQGILEMKGEMQCWPDANSTIRYTFGRLKGYSPRDGVYYNFQTTMEGVIEKEDPTNPEYYLHPRIKEIYQQGDFGSYALENGKMPVDICATTHTTGGNSGSPVIDRYGNLVGLNFDRNWEGVGGDISYLPDYQRSIICDVRYVLLILDKYLGAQRLLNEMVIAK